MVLANELLDNLPFDLLEYRDGARGTRCGSAAGDGDGLVEVLVPAAAELAAEADRLVGGPAGAGGGADGARIPLQRAAPAWLRQALGVLAAGPGRRRSTTPTPPPAWPRGPGRTGCGPTAATAAAAARSSSPASQDITCVVAVDQLAARPAGRSSDRPRPTWLAAHGIDDLVEAARAHVARAGRTSATSRR